MNVVAIVVTYHRVEKLRQCLEHLLAGEMVPDHIIVVDNASPDNTRLMLEGYASHHSKVKPIYLDKNIGGAGGFEIGMKKAFELGASHFWIMDDDCYVEPSSLLHLIETQKYLENESKRANNPIGFICSKVNWIDGSVCEMNQPTVDWDYLNAFQPECPAIKVTGASFVSCLVTKQAVEKVGFPIGEFFIWFDDAEYTRRISAQFDCYCALKSQVTHHTQNNEGVWFGNINQYNIGKFNYGARNESWYRFHKQGVVEWLYFIAVRYREMKQGRVLWRYRIRIFKQLFVGVLGGFIN